MKRTFFSIPLFLTCCNLFGQTNYLNFTNVIPPSPEAAGLMRYVSMPVNHSTGVPDISIPIYKLEQGVLSVPISISYHAGGIRARDIASVIGLGWSLQAGGLISRSVIGTHDENAVLPPYRSSAQITNAQNTMTGSLATTLASELNQMDQHFSEYMTDRYGFNFNGNGGTFRNIKSSSGEDLIYTVPYKPWKIEKKYESGSLPEYQRLYYVITDDNGIQYEFKSSERTNGVITGWRLVKITSADLTDDIRFYYSGLESMSVESNSYAVEAGKTINVVDGNDWVRDVQTRTSSTGATNSEVQQLDSIVSKNGSVNFYYLKDRYDGRTTRLQRIKVLRGTEIIRDVSFNQSYFGSAGDHTARMRLDGVNFNDVSGLSVEKYGFTYNTDINVPGYYYTSGYVPPEKIREDYWGYYNGSSGGGLPAEFLNFLTPNEANVYNGNRNPSVSDMKAYILKEMRLPTGGKTVFEFECNETNDPTFYGYSSPHGGVIGGLRVKNIKHYLSDNTLAESKSYTYDEAGIFQRIQANLFQYMYFKRFFNRDVVGWIYPEGDQMFTGCSTITNYPLSVLDHSPIFYSKVTEYNGTETVNSGKTVYHYLLPENPTIGANGSLLPPWKIGAFQSDKGDISSLLSKVETFENVGSNYKLRAKKENIYTKTVENQFITGVVLYQDPIYIHNQTLSRYREPSPGETYAVYNGTFQHEDLIAHQFVRYLSSTTDSTYFDNLPAVGQKTDFSYNNLPGLVSANSTTTAIHSQPLQINVEDSRGTKIISTFTYPVNYSGSPYTNMLQKNMINSVIEHKKFKTNTTTTPIEGEKVDYAIWNGNNNQIYPSSFYKFRPDLAVFEKRESILGYDINGNLTSFSKISDMPTVLIWGYNGAYPIAKIENASQTDIVAYSGFETSEKGGWSYTGSNNAWVKHSGQYAYLLSSSSSISKTGLDPTKTYQLNVFVAGTNFPVVSGGTLVTSKSFPGSVWTKHEFVLKNASSLTIAAPASISIMVDDISLHPQDAKISTYTFDPLKGMTSITDPKGTVEYYDYDGFQRLKTIYDVDRNVIKSFEYNYKH